jgi:hypothetical protein
VLAELVRWSQVEVDAKRTLVRNRRVFMVAKGRTAESVDPF